MRQVLLAGKYYKITGDIIKKAVSPWMAKISSGSKEYSDFSQAALEEYHDFRNGIGLESELPAESARTWWTEGIDFSTPRSAVLGPLVNTAEYDTWEGTHDYSLLNFVIPTATKLTGYCYECTTDAGSSGATEPTWPTTVGNTVGDGGITWTCRAYLAPIKIIDFKGTAETKETYIIQNSRILKWDGTNLDCVDNTLANPIDAIVVTDPTDEYLVVSSATDAIYSVDGTAWIAFPDAKCMGYLAFYDTKLRALDADGGTLHSSPANDIDGTWTEFNLTGQFGTVYDLFEGKLLADGTPTLYFCGTEGLFTIDVTNEKAYKQEVAYPDLTYAGHKGMYWNANVWVATGYGILKVTPSMATFIGPDLDDGLPTGYQGDIYDMVTVNNWLVFCVKGSVKGGLVETLKPNGAGTYTQMDIGGDAPAGTNWESVDEAVADEDDTFVYTNVALEEDTYAIEDSSGIGTINKITVYFRTKATHSGANVRAWIRSGTTNAVGDSETPAVDHGAGVWGTYSHEWALNPDDSAAWEWADIDALEIGVSTAGIAGTASFTQVYVEVDYTTTTGISKSSILKRNSSYGGNLQVYTTSAVNKPIACLHHSPSSLYTNGRLWFGEDTDVKYMMFPDTTSNVKQLADYEYVDDSEYGKLPIFRKLAAITKVALGAAVITKSCDANEYVTLYYGLNGAAPATFLGSFKTSPRPTILTFGGGLGIQFYTIQFAIKLIRGATSTNSPELESLLFYYLPRPAIINAWTFNVLCIEDNAETLIAEFEDIAKTKTLVVFNPTGDELKTDFNYNVALTTMPMKFWVEEQGTREAVVQITCEEVFKG